MAGGQVAVTSRDQIEAGEQKGGLPLGFFALVFGLSAPIWLLSGKNKLPLPINLPVSALTTFVPALAASILTYRQSGMRGVRDLWKRVFDFRRVKNKIWYVPVLLLAPTIHVVSYGIMRMAGMPLPDTIDIPLASAPAFAVMFFIGDTGEELGWMAYATDRMQGRWGALKASLIFGAVYAGWHAIPFVQTGNAASWIVWQSLNSVALRVLHTWVYNNTGQSLFATTLFHGSVNMSWTYFPNYGSHYNPFVTGLITMLTTALIAFGWGSRTLARVRIGKGRAAQHIR